MSLDGKIALVTGASRGIGQGIALRLAQAGASVVGTATTQAGADSIAERIDQAGGQGFGLVLNVSDLDSIQHLVAQVQERIGAPHIVVNNAAITRDNLLLRMKDDEWQSVMDTNLTALFHMTKLSIKPMIKARWGRIINISSVVGSTGNAGQANYAAAKAGMIGFTKSLAQEIASRGVTVNAVSPGFIDTDMTRDLPEAQKTHLLQQIPMGRLGQPEEIAHCVRFLCSDEASYMTGQTLHVNGGMFMG